MSAPLLSFFLELLLSFLVLDLLGGGTIGSTLTVFATLAIAFAVVNAASLEAAIGPAMTMIFLGHDSNGAVVSLGHYHFTFFEDVVCSNLGEAFFACLS